MIKGCVSVALIFTTSHYSFLDNRVVLPSVRPSLERKEGRNKTSFFTPSCFLGPRVPRPHVSKFLRRNKCFLKVYEEMIIPLHSFSSTICGAEGSRMPDGVMQMSCGVNVTLLAEEVHDLLFT